MQYRSLGNTDLSVSILGFGGAPLGQEYGDLDEGDGARAVAHAIDAGINFFDVAPYYGRTLAEERLGRALEGRRDEAIMAVPDEFADEISLVGPIERIRDRLEAWKASPVTTIVVGANDPATMRTMAELVLSRAAGSS